MGFHARASPGNRAVQRGPRARAARSGRCAQGPARRGTLSIPARQSPSPGRIFAILIVRDEADIIEQSLDHIASWAHRVFVLDTGSLDGTWKLVERIARGSSVIVPVARQPLVFDDGLRAAVFARFRGQLRPGDWLARPDADEFFAVDPRRFLAESVRPRDGVVVARQFVFGMTRAEAAAWEAAPEDRSVPIAQRRLRFTIDEFPEARFVRFRPGLRWGGQRSVPSLPGLIARERIPMAHYRYRDPPQMAWRATLRTVIAQHNTRVGRHWAQQRWRRWLLDPQDPRVLGVCADGSLPPVPEPARDLRAPLLKRAAQQVVYRLGLHRVLDAMLPRPSPTLDEAQPLDESTRRALIKAKRAHRRRWSP